MNITEKQKKEFYSLIADELLKNGLKKVEIFPEHNTIEIWTKKGMTIFPVTCKKNSSIGMYTIIIGAGDKGKKDIEIYSRKLKESIKVLAEILKNGSKENIRSKT